MNKRPLKGEDKLDQAFERVCIILAGFFGGMLAFAFLFSFLNAYYLDRGSGKPADAVLYTIVIFPLVCYFFWQPLGGSVIIAELLGLRNFLYYVIMWGLIGFLPSHYTPPSFHPGKENWQLEVATTASTSGGGLIYWLIAGRSTSRRSRRPKRPPVDDGRAKPTGDWYRRP